jgi:hypothetical protein
MSEERRLHEKEEKARTDPLRYLFFGLVVVALGVTLYLGQIGRITQWLWYFVVGLGCVFLVDVALRSAIPEYRRPTIGRVIAGLFFIVLGTAFIYDYWNWALMIVIIGILIAVYGIYRTMRPVE